MPTYEYRCTKPDCGEEFEIVAKMSDPAPNCCPACGSERCLEKKISRVSAFVKGGAIAKESAKAYIKDQAIVRSGGDKAPVPLAKPIEDPVHVCTKYCSHHGKAQ